MALQRVLLELNAFSNKERGQPWPRLVFAATALTSDWVRVSDSVFNLTLLKYVVVTVFAHHGRTDIVFCEACWWESEAWVLEQQVELWLFLYPSMVSQAHGASPFFSVFERVAFFEWMDVGRCVGSLAAFQTKR